MREGSDLKRIALTAAQSFAVRNFPRKAPDAEQMIQLTHMSFRIKCDLARNFLDALHPILRNTHTQEILGHDG